MELVQEIKQCVLALDPTLEIEDTKIKIFLNRIRVYLNRSDVPFILVGTIAEMIVEQHALARKNDEEIISSISDNGQTISFSNKVFSSMTSQSDSQLFGSHTSILNRFRKVGVIGVNPFKNAEINE